MMLDEKMAACILSIYTAKANCLFTAVQALVRTQPRAFFLGRNLSKPAAMRLRSTGMYVRHTCSVLIQLQLHSWRASRLSHEAVNLRTAHNPACAHLSALFFTAEQHYLHRPHLRNTLSSPRTRFLDRSAA